MWWQQATQYAVCIPTIWKNNQQSGTAAGHGWRQQYATSLSHLLHWTSKQVNSLSFAWFQASAAKQMRTALFRAITQWVVVITYWRFETPIGFLTLEVGTDRMYRNVGKELPLLVRNSWVERSSQFVILIKTRKLSLIIFIYIGIP